MELRSAAAERFPLTSSWVAGIASGVIALGVLALWLFWGRALQAAIALGALSFGLALWRYPALMAGATGFMLIANIGAFIPGSSSAFFGLAMILLILRKIVAADFDWRSGTFYVPLLVFLTWLECSYLWADNPREYEWDIIFRVLLAVFAVGELIKTPGLYLAFFVGTAIGMIFTSVSAIKTAMEFYTSGVADQIATSVTSIEKSRFFGHWPDPNIMSMTISASLGCVIALWRTKLHFAVRTLMFFAAATGIAAILISLSRTGLIGCIIVVGMMLAIEKRRLFLSSLVLGLVVLLLYFLPVDLFGRFLALFQGGDASTGERTNLLVSGWQLFWDNPVFGGGIGYFENSVLFLVPHLPHFFFAHNTFVDLAVDTGIVGVFLYFLCIWYAFKGLEWRTWKVDTNDTGAMLNAGLRASLVATIFSVATMSSKGYIPFWVLFTMCAFFAANFKRDPNQLTAPVQ